jgi:hypothetical protein
MIQKKNILFFTGIEKMKTKTNCLRGLLRFDFEGKSPVVREGYFVEAGEKGDGYFVPILQRKDVKGLQAYQVMFNGKLSPSFEKIEGDIEDCPAFSTRVNSTGYEILINSKVEEFSDLKKRIASLLSE